MREFLYWSPRVLGILFILFISVFALDIFGQGYTFWETVVGLFMHLIPSLMMIVALALGWRKDALGALLYATVGIIFLAQFGYVWLVAGSPFIIAALFAASTYQQEHTAV
ncbi:MAG: hypothetical protein HYZ26_02135 [Chloroflexi bacterium]|nr:hypothetical protein [Chloroflexota bacterium]